MEADTGAPEEMDVLGAIPERWETTVEDVAQLVGLALDRAQDLADVVNDVARTRPDLMKAVVAGTVGAVAGVLLADLVGRPRQGLGHSPRKNSVSHERPSRTAPSAAAEPREAGRRSFVQLGDAADLFPLAVTVLGNPVVRRFLFGVALRAIRR